MVSKRKTHDGMYTEVKRIVVREGEPEVKQTSCCCKAPGDTRKECANVTGNKTPCRCDCHSKK